MQATTKLGRNDPCHCGSGKKYKRCHLPIEEKARLDARPPAPEIPHEPQADHDPGEASPEWRGGLPRFKNVQEVFKMATRTDWLKRDPELRRLVKENETLFNYLGSEKEIEAALAKLEPYGGEFRKLAGDEAAFLERCEKLFSEEVFAPLRFTASDVERALKEAGISPNRDVEEDLREHLLKGVRFLASKERRDHLALELMLRLPKYVEEGRYLDALLVEFAAQATQEDLGEVNTFLLRMFLFGLKAWEEKRDQEQTALLREIGLDLKAGMGPEEIDAWVAQQSADPAKTAHLEKLIAAHPEVLDSLGLSREILARRSVKLLEREDSRCLWLGGEEIETWAAFLLGKVQLMLERYGPEEGQDEIPEEKQKQAFAEIYLPGMREVAKSIFTPQRLEELTGDLRAYRNRLFAAGEKMASFWAMSAINYIEHEDDPAQNVFLITLCGKSIHRLGERAGVED